MKKRLGQHFLIDKHIIHRILLTAQVTAQDHILEIGPGHGALTVKLASKAKAITAIEYDAAFAKSLQAKFAAHPHVRILHADARTITYTELFPDREQFQSGVKVVANLPYYAAVPILLTIFQEIHLFQECTFMFQKEVAERISAAPGGKAYGILSITAQYYTVPEYCFSIPPQAFRPRPKVMSAVIKLRCLHQPRLQVHDEAHFFQLTQCGFRSRRKTLKNALKTHCREKFPIAVVDRAFEQLHLPERIRGEQLSPEDFANLSNTLIQIQGE